jgi:hypothetical protein
MLARSHTHPPYPPAVRERTPGRVSARANERTNYVLIIRPEPDDVPAEIRLRRFLKMALRSHGLRCIDVREAPMTGSAADRPANHPATATAGIPDGGRGDE